MTHSFPARRSSDFIVALAAQQGDALPALLYRHLALQLAAVADVVKVDHLANVGKAEAGALGAQYPRQPRPVPLRIDARQSFARRADQPFVRSEEHTSKLQSLMRISYAVFCL